MRREQTVGFSIKALSNQIKRYIDKTKIDTGENYTGMQCAIINFIGDRTPEEDIFQKDVEAEFNIRRSTATGILQTMEKNDIITREPVSRDARLKKLGLTKKALKVYGQITEHILEVDQQMKKDIPDEELEIFLKVLHKIYQNLDT